MVCQRPITLINVPSQYGAGKTAHGRLWMDRISDLQNYLVACGLPMREPKLIDVPAVAEPGNMNCKWLQQVTRVNQALFNAVTETLAGGVVPVIIGGDHSVAMGSVTATVQFMAGAGLQPALLWADAHCDMNTVSTTPSGNIHGMALAHICGLAPELGIPGSTFIEPLVAVDNIAVVGLRFTDVAERPNIVRAGLRPITMDEIDDAGIGVILRDRITPLLMNTAGVHLSFDLDAVNPSEAPAVNTPAPGGLTFREARQLCEAVAYSGKLVTMDLVEHDADAGRDEVMLPVMGELIATALGAGNMSVTTERKLRP